MSATFGLLPEKLFGAERSRASNNSGFLRPRCLFHRDRFVVKDGRMIFLDRGLSMTIALWHSDEDLDRLDAVLSALPADNDPMILAEFDGFCAGLITCPEMISPSIWLAKVWGTGGPPEFDSAEELQAALDLIMAHYNRVAGMLMIPGEYFPVLDEDQRNGDIIWEFWMMGFVAAMRLRPDAWDLIEDSKDRRAKKALDLAGKLSRISTGFAEGKGWKATKLSREAHDLIPDMVEDLNAFAKAHTARPMPGLPLAANLAAAPSAAPKPGRNDACNCGSGRKFKKCCGAVH